MMTFKELVLLLLPLGIIGGLVWFDVVGIVDFIKWYKERNNEID